MPLCEHNELFLSSLNVSKTYKRPSNAKILAALSSSSVPKNKNKGGSKSRTVSSGHSAARAETDLPSSSTFPAPLVLPGDELEIDPDYPPQSAQEWVDEEDRNEVTSDQRTIYVVPPPKVSHHVSFMNAWTAPKALDGNDKSESRQGRLQREFEVDSEAESGRTIAAPSVDDIAEYLRAFYHGLSVKILRKPKLEFTSWESGIEAKHRPPHVGLSTGSEVVRVRTRSSTDALFRGQLNLDDLLDTALSILPEDAYALLMLVNHDIYENEEDDFCCGRAYGGSRVAVVSTARYRPDLDATQGLVNLEHVWPSSHCLQHISATFSPEAFRMARKRKFEEHSGDQVGTPMSAAIAASSQTPVLPSPTALSTLWLGRVCKTASHELGHCFGIDHCIYFACVMQGTASLTEDSRQPPYVCPVDLVKILRATGANEKDRYTALLRFCEKWPTDRMFAAFAAWIKSRIGEEDLHA